MADPFFTQKNCDKCGGELSSRKMCWFTEDIMCGECSIKQGQFRMEMRKSGINDYDYEGCGYIPTKGEKNEQ